MRPALPRPLRTFGRVAASRPARRTCPVRPACPAGASASPIPLIVTNDGPPRNATCDRPLIRVRSSINSVTVSELSEADTDGPFAASPPPPQSTPTAL